MVRTLTTSGCRVQVALAPAGAGKTAALRVLARSWQASGGTVLGLAPTAVAADELGAATGIRSDTLAKYLHQTTGAGAAGQDQGGSISCRLGPGTLVLIDEAGMAGTRDLAAVVRHVVDAGGSVRLVGDAAEHLQLGYASTIHGAQGATVDTTHTVLSGTESRQALYVALSRGRATNHLYLATPTASLDDVRPGLQDTAVEPRQVLTDILARDGRATRPPPSNAATPPSS